MVIDYAKMQHLKVMEYIAKLQAEKRPEDYESWSEDEKRDYAQGVYFEKYGTACE